MTHPPGDDGATITGGGVVAGGLGVGVVRVGGVVPDGGPVVAGGGTAGRLGDIWDAGSAVLDGRGRAGCGGVGAGGVLRWVGPGVVVAGAVGLPLVAEGAVSGGEDRGGALLVPWSVLT